MKTTFSPKFSSNSKNKQTKTLKINKISPSPSIKNKINELFNNPDLYLQLPYELKDNYIIGKKLQGPRYDSQDKLISYSIIGNPFSYKRRNLKSGLGKQKSFLQTGNNYHNLTRNVNNLDEPLITETKLNDKDVESIFKKFEENIEKNKNDNNKILKGIKCPKVYNNYIKKPLILQEKHLKLNKNINNFRKDFEDKTNKFLNLNNKTENKIKKNLLLNNSDLYTLKKENINYIFSQLKDNKGIGNGLQNWAFSLRCSKNFKGIRREYVNVGTDKKPLWVKLQKRYQIETDNIFNPNWNNNFIFESDNNNNNSNFNSSDNTNICVKSFSPFSSRNLTEFISANSPSFKNFVDKTINLADLQVDGKNLFKLEKEIYKKFKGNKKKVYRIKYEKECIENLKFCENWMIKSRNKKNSL
jgi:hypothetical protein